MCSINQKEDVMSDVHNLPPMTGIDLDDAEQQLEEADPVKLADTAEELEDEEEDDESGAADTEE